MEEINYWLTGGGLSIGIVFGAGATTLSQTEPSSVWFHRHMESYGLEFPLGMILILALHYALAR